MSFNKLEYFLMSKATIEFMCEDMAQKYGRVKEHQDILPPEVDVINEQLRSCPAELAIDQLMHLS